MAFPEGYRPRIGPWLVKKEIMHKLHITQDKMTILDVGAYKGDVTAMYQRMWPKATYHLFEPIPGPAQRLKERFSDQERVHIHQLALWSESHPEGVPMFVGGQGTEMSSLLDRSMSRRYFRHLLDDGKRLTVPTSTLDDFVKEEKISKVHLIKADIQGAEGEMLRGAKKVLRYKKPLMLYLEVFFIPMYDASEMFWDLCHFLIPFGYTLFDMYGFGRSRVNRQLKYADALFISEKVRVDVLDTYPPDWLSKSLEQAMGMK